MSERGMRFRVGLFVLGGLVLLAVLSTFFTSFPHFFEAHDQYAVAFSDATGVGPGTPVRRSGVRVGEVTKVQLDDETGQVRVGIRVARQHAPRNNDQPTLVRGPLGGDVSIDFVPKTAVKGQVADRTPIAPGTELAGAQGVDMTTLMGQASEVLPTTQESLNAMRKTMQRYEQLAPDMERALGEFRDLSRAAREMVPELRRTNDEVRGLAQATRETIPALRRTNEEFQVTTRNWGKLGERLDGLVQTNQDKMIKALDDFTDTINRVGRVFNDENQRNLSATLKNVKTGTDNLQSISKNTDELVKESRQTIQRVNDSITRTNDVLGNLQKATRPMAERGDRVMTNLDESTAKLNRLMDEAAGLVRVLNQGDGTLRRLLNDPALYQNLNAAAFLLVHILPRMEPILHDLEVFSDKIARHPESLGLGGVVAPSSGLKESPSANPSWFRH